MRSARSSRGSASSCRAKSTTSRANDSSGSGKSEKISKYFWKESGAKKDKKLTKKADFDSPYKENLSKQKAILNDTASDESDFKTPKVLRWQQKIARRVNETKNKVGGKGSKATARSKAKQTTLTKLIERQLSYSDTNPEHLQMAIALSKSEQATEDLEDCPGPATFPTTQEKILNVRTTLEQFGFRSNKTSGPVTVESTKRSKTSKFHFITPVLFIRKQEDRDLEITKRISSILAEDVRPCEAEKREYFTSSDYLEGLLSAGSNYFQRNNLECSSQNLEDFYVEALNIPHSTLKCSHLLKDWSTIPGRDKSPCRITIDDNDFKRKEENTQVLKSEGFNGEENLAVNKNTLNYRGLSPDLFESDDEMQEGRNSTNEIKTDDITTPPNDTTDSLRPLEFTLSPGNVHRAAIGLPQKVVALSASMMSNFRSPIGSSESDCEMFESDRGISHFESFSADTDVSQRFNVTEGFEDEIRDGCAVGKRRRETVAVNIERTLNEVSEMLDDGVFDLSRKESALCIEISDSDSENDQNEDKGAKEVLEENCIKGCKRNSFEISTTRSPEKSEFGVREKVLEGLNEKTVALENQNSDHKQSMFSQSNINESLETLNASRYENLSDLLGTQISSYSFEEQISNAVSSRKHTTLMKDQLDTDLLTDSLCFGEKSSTSITDHMNEVNSTLENFNTTELIERILNKDCTKDNDDVIMDLTQDSDEELLASEDENEHSDSYPEKSNNAAAEASDDLERISRNNDNVRKTTEEDENTINDRTDKTSKKNYLKFDTSSLTDSFCFGEQSSGLFEKQKATTLVTNKSWQSKEVNDTLENFNITEYIERVLNKTRNGLGYKCNDGGDVVLDLTQDSDDEDEKKLADINEENFNESAVKIPGDFERISLSNDSWIEDDKRNKAEEDSDGINDLEVLEYEKYFNVPMNNDKYIEHIDNYENEYSKHFNIGSEDKKYEVLSDSDGFDELGTTETRNIVDEDKNYNSNSIKFFDALITKPVGSDQEELEQFALLADTHTPKKFRKSLSFDQRKSIRKPTPTKQIRRSLTFSSPSENSKKQLFSFKRRGDVEKYASLNSLIDGSDTVCISDEEVDCPPAFSTPNVKRDERSYELKEPNVNKRIAELRATPSGVIIKTKNVTPMPDYDGMNTPTIATELEKVGVKSLKRHRGVQILKHIYESMHPIVGLRRGQDGEDVGRAVKRRRTDEVMSSVNDVDHSDSCEVMESCNVQNNGVVRPEGAEAVEIVGDIPESDELIFERTRVKRVALCALPLHIAWHNFLACNSELKENILLYVPLQLEVLHTMLKEQGFKYHLQDLLAFLDKKCITTRTSQQSSQNRQRRKNKE